MVLINSCTNINDPLPKFEANTVDGVLITDKDFEGKILVINIWATWCGPCIQEIPELNKLVAYYKNDNEVEFLAITDESARKVNQLLRKYPFYYKHIAEAKLLKHKLHPGIVKSIPYHIIIGKDGQTKFEFTGSKPNMKDFLCSEIDKVKNQ